MQTVLLLKGFQMAMANNLLWNLPVLRLVSNFLLINFTAGIKPRK